MSQLARQVYDRLKVGLGLWNHRIAALGLELALLALAGGWWARRHARRPAAWIFLSALAVLQIGYVYGPAPATPRQQVLTALVMYVVLAAAAGWVDRGHRSPSPVSRAGLAPREAARND